MLFHIHFKTKCEENDSEFRVRFTVKFTVRVRFRVQAERFTVKVYSKGLQCRVAVKVSYGARCLTSGSSLQ